MLCAAYTQRHTTCNNSLELLDGMTQQVLGALAAHRATGASDATVPLVIPSLGPPAIMLTIPLHKPFPAPARLQTLRRQFVRRYASKAESGKLALGSAAPEREIATLFVAWLQETLAL